MFHCAERFRYVHSDIRGELYREALLMEANGTKVLKLNTGNPGKFGFTMPDSVRESLTIKMEDAVPYCDVRGMKDAREAICAYHQSKGLQNITPDDIYLTNGVSEAASMLMSAVLDPGDEILLPSPCYSLWSNNAYLCGAKPVFYRCDPDNDWNPDIRDIRSKVNARTKALLIINPNNPTGAVYSRDVLEEIASVARSNRLLLISDEIYDRLVMDDIEHISIAALAPDIPSVTLNGLSKSHIICGFRCGWMVFSDGNGEIREIQNAVMQLASMRLCGNALTQTVIPAALDDEASTKAMLIEGGRLYEQRRAVIEALDGIPGVSFVKNRAAFYLFPGLAGTLFDFENAQDFAMKFLHEKHILAIPGNGFDWHEDIRFRIVMLPEPAELTAAMKSLSDFLNDHRRVCTK